MWVGLYSPRAALLEQQRTAIEEFNQTACLDLTLRCFENYRELSQGVTNLPLDILFYDTEESQELETQLMRVFQTLPNCRLVLLSDSERHAVFGYAVRAAGYLTLPLDNEDFLSTLILLLRERLQAKEQFLPVKVNGVWSRLNMRHITYLESSGHSLIFHMNSGRSIRAAAGFRDYQSLLDLNTDFLRCHKSYVVNLRYVQNWEMDGFTLTDGSTVNISRPYWQTARSVYACYMTQSRDEPRLERSQPSRFSGREAQR